VSDAVAQRVRELAASASVEVTPRDARRLAEVEPLPHGSSVYITALPGHDTAELVEAAVAIRAAGHSPVPHIAARGISDEAALDRLLGHEVAEQAVERGLVADTAGRNVGHRRVAGGPDEIGRASCRERV